MKKIYLFLFAILLFGCKKEYVPVLSTSDLQDISSAGATSGGNITYEGSSAVIRRGVCWSTSANPTINDNKTTDSSGTGEYTSRISGLSGDTRYFVRAYASNNCGTGYGSEISFQTLSPGLPEISTKTPVVLADDGVYYSYITTGGDIYSDGGSEVISRGVCWSTTNQLPSITDNLTADGSGTGSYLSRINKFLLGTTYYIRAYATNSIGTMYGPVLTIKTPCYLSMMGYYYLNLSTPIDKGFGVSLNANLKWNCSGAGPMLFDVYLDTIPDPKKKIAADINTSSFTLSGLDSATTYYWKIYAYNPVLACDQMTSSVYSFTTIGLPFVKTLDVSRYSFSSAELGGEITGDGGAAVTDYGFFWGTSADPEVTGNKIPVGSGTGSFSHNLTTLSPFTTYYVRAYATNKFGTAYGACVEFKTDKNTYIPELITNKVIDYTSSTALVGGYIINEGAYAVTERGIYYGTSENPEVTGTKIQIGSGKGLFSYSLTGLIPGTTYYLKAYAVNQEGSGFGSAVTFNTGHSSTFPSVTDYEGNIYHIVQIGSQTWMAENLKSTKYSDGTPIPLVNTVSTWNAIQEGQKAYCWYNDDPANKDTYGALYTWAAAMNGAASSDKNPSGIRGVCPVGWHLPSMSEWDQLRQFLGGEAIAGGKMKETGTGHWLEPNIGATNESGFTGLPGNSRPWYGVFGISSASGFWWSSNIGSNSSLVNYSRSVRLGCYGANFENSEAGRTSGLSVRCVKD